MKRFDCRAAVMKRLDEMGLGRGKAPNPMPGAVGPSVAHLPISERPICTPLVKAPRVSKSQGVEGRRFFWVLVVLRQGGMAVQRWCYVLSLGS